MVTVGDAQNGKRKLEDVGNPRIFPHVKAFNKHYGVMIAAGLMVIVLAGQIVQTAVDFCYGEPKRNNDRRDGRR